MFVTSSFYVPNKVLKSSFKPGPKLCFNLNIAFPLKVTAFSPFGFKVHCVHEYKPVILKIWQTQEKMVLFLRAGSLADLQHSDSTVHASLK